MGVSANPYATELHAAVLTGRITSVRRFLDRGARMTARDKIQRTPLHWAVAVGFEDVAKILLISTPPRSLQAGDKYGRTVLHYAAASGNVSLARVMINRGASVAAEDQRLVTPLHLAAEQVNPEMVQLLLGHGAACGAEDVEGRTPRDYAERMGSAECARLLREAEGRAAERVQQVAGATAAEGREADLTGNARAVSSAGIVSTPVNARPVDAAVHMKENARGCKGTVAATKAPGVSDGPLQPSRSLGNVFASDLDVQGNGQTAETGNAGACSNEVMLKQGGFVVTDGNARRVVAGEVHPETCIPRVALPAYAEMMGAGEVGFAGSGRFEGARCGEKQSLSWGEGWGVLRVLGAV